MVKQATRKCVVIGAGVIGACVAYRLAQQGHRVTLIDSGDPGDGTSQTSGAWVNVNAKRDAHYFELGVAGISSMRRLSMELPADSWYKPNGAIEWATTQQGVKDLQDRMAYLSELRYGARWLSKNEVLGALEPDVIIDDGVDGVAFFPDEASVYVRPLVGELLHAFERLGGAFIFNDAVKEITQQGRAARGVRLASGQVVEADIVITCCGRWTMDFLKPLGINVPLVEGPTKADGSVDTDLQGRRAASISVYTQPTAAKVSRKVLTPTIWFRPDGGGRLLVRSQAADKQTTAETQVVPTPIAATQLIEELRTKVRFSRELPIGEIRVALRPLPKDGYPIIGWADQVDGLYVVATHIGVVLAGIFGELVTAEIAGKDSPMLAPYRLGRFSSR